LASWVSHHVHLLLDGCLRSMYMFLLSAFFSFYAGSSLCKFFFYVEELSHDYWNSWSYSSTLAYLVDANNGRSSTAVASNSAFRGFFAFVATEIAVPLQVCIGFGDIKIFSYIIPLGRCRGWYVFPIFTSKGSGRFFFVGWLYTIWAGIMLLSGSLIVLVWWKGGQWREAAQEREAACT
jgi:hypothetical protein